MEDILFGFILRHRSFPRGEGEGGWGLMNRVDAVQVCDARDDDSSNAVDNKIKI
jgi:hypothetical protein